MPLYPSLMTDFAFGELSDDYAASDAEAKKRSLKRGRNVRVLNSYGIAQRPGSRWLQILTGSGIAVELVVTGGESFVGVVRAGGMDIYTDLGGLVQSVGGAPWSVDEVMQLTWHTRENKLYVAHNRYWLREFSFDGSTWSLGLFAFDAGAGGSSNQPYYRFAQKGITLTPGALTGTGITVQFSADVLEAAHVGVRFRYGASSDGLKELVIASVVDGQNGTADVIDALPPTFNVEVGSSSGYRVGEIVEGQDSHATGVVVDVPDGTHVTVLMSNGYEGFDVAGPERLVGPNSSSEIAGITAATNPAASTAWDEAVFSDVRGYPGDVFEHGGRLGFADFPQIADAFMLSAPGAPGDFNLGDGTAGSAIFYRLGGAGGERILYCVSSANLIIITTKKVRYIPETDGIPLAADTIAVPEIGGASGGSSAFPLATDEGVIYVEAGGNRVMGVLTTGDAKLPWKLDDLSKRGAQHIKNPVSLAITTGNSQAPERYIFALNADGTLACMFYDTNPPRLGWTSWDTDGSYLAMVPLLGIIYAVCEREIGGNTVYLLERLDEDCQLDASNLFEDAGGYLEIITDEGDALVTDLGEVIVTDNPAMPQLAGQTVRVIRTVEGYCPEYLGEFEVDADGVIQGIAADDGGFEAGVHFDMDVVLWPGENEQDKSPMFSKRRVNRCAVRVKKSGSYKIGILDRDVVNTRPTYDQGDDISAPPPLRSEVKRWVLTGYEDEPSVQITRPLPVPLCVLGVKQEVAGK